MQIDTIQNAEILAYTFLKEMYKDPFYPNFLVDKCKFILLTLCAKIEENETKTLDELYQLSHFATEEINQLEEEFYRHNSEIETVARECLASGFEYCAKAYGFQADVEELIANRDW